MKEDLFSRFDTFFSSLSSCVLVFNRISVDYVIRNRRVKYLLDWIEQGNEKKTHPFAC